MAEPAAAAPQRRNGAYRPTLVESPPIAADARALLAAAIARHDAARDALAKITEAQRRAPDTLDASSAVEAAQSALAEAKSAEPAWLVANLMGEDGGENPVASAVPALDAAEAALALARAIRTLLEQRQLAAEAKVRWESGQVRDAVAGVLLSSPEVAALLEAFAAARSRVAALRACLRAVSGAGGVADRFWGEREEPDGSSDPEAAAWRVAIGRLASDPTVTLP